MVHDAEFMDVADSDFLSNNREFDDDDSEFETVFENYFAFSAARNRFFGRKRPVHVVLGSGIGFIFTNKWIDIRAEPVELNAQVFAPAFWISTRRVGFRLGGLGCGGVKAP
ncbi:reticulon-like protein B1-like [Trifolium pratense]|uniref:Reticulon-like protein B1-like n=1 Tax=Trifolium pratense TaxID=57577 RepID=A0A2K3LIT7_TRIPR|nr:reticulon-like protein B1-like [Trifolium pratense]